MRQVFLRILQNAGLIIVSFGLLYGGIAIVQSGIAFWNLVYGLPAVSLGIILSVLTFNEITQNKNGQNSQFHLVECKVCHKQTLAPLLIDSVVCSNCQYKMAVRLNLTALSLFILISLPITLHLSSQNQDIRQRAKTEPSPVCESGIWNPDVCRCGSWDVESSCSGRARNCGNVTFCCNETSPDNWRCEIK